MINRDALLRILFAGFLLYLALPAIQEITTSLGAIFWACWIVFFLFVVGANLGILLNVQPSKVVKQREVKKVLMKQN